LDNTTEVRDGDNKVVMSSKIMEKKWIINYHL
jgi:hypothetical protein